MDSHQKFLAWERTSNDTFTVSMKYVHICGDFVAGSVLSYLVEVFSSNEKPKVMKTTAGLAVKRKEIDFKGLNMHPSTVRRALSSLSERKYVSEEHGLIILKLDAIVKAVGVYVNTSGSQNSEALFEISREVSKPFNVLTLGGEAYKLIGKYELDPNMIDSERKFREMMFDVAWNEYGYKIGKESARKAWKKIKYEEMDVLLKIIPKFKKWKDETGTAPLHFSTFLNGRRWNDELSIKANEDMTSPFTKDLRNG